MAFIFVNIIIYDRIRKGLEDGIRHAQGEITLKATTLEMTDPLPLQPAVHDRVRARRHLV